MTSGKMAGRIVRHDELRPCKTAFIDARTPGSDLKDNFTIIGAGVTENPGQHVHIKETPGFNIGAAGQPPGCVNSLHYHHTAEVFFALKGRWRFFWGLRGTAGEVTLEEGDIFNIPTGVFRGFENTGAEYGMIMSILGGDDAGGGVVWAPQVIEDAKGHGLILGDDGRIYDTLNGETPLEGVAPAVPVSEEEAAAMPEPSTAEVASEFVARYPDMTARAANGPCAVIGPEALIKDRPGFEVDFITRGSVSAAPYICARHEVLMVMRGSWRFVWDENGAPAETVLGPGDTCAAPPGMPRALSPVGGGEASLFRVRSTGDPAGPTSALM